MKKRLSIILICALSLVLLCTICLGAYAVSNTNGASDIIKYWLGVGEKPDNADKNEDGKVDVLDLINLVKEQNANGAYLENITLDDSAYTFGTFKRGVTEYTVELPEGRPNIPRVSAEAPEGFDIEISQGYIPDGQSEGCAYVKVTNGKKSTVYTVKFVRNIENGFVLQYDDRYTLPIAEEGYTYASNSEALTVDGNGLMVAKKVTDTPITVTATKGNDTKTFKVDRIEKAHINLFFITGQSNGQGCYDGVNYDGSTETEFDGQIPYVTQLKTVEKIGQDGRVYSYDVHPRPENQDLSKIGDPSLTIPAAYTLYDMNMHAKQGHQASLGKVWYDYTGEKVVFLQSAWSGAPIESWLDPDRYEEAGGYGIATRNFYQTTKDGYNKLLPILDENYEIIRKANFWCQGSTAMTCHYDKSISNYIFSSDPRHDVTKLLTDAQYYEFFMRIDKDMREDFGLEYNGIMSVRAQGTTVKTELVPIASAHLALPNNNEGIFLATRKLIEIARQANSTDTTSEGYAFVGKDNAHYNQIGFNYQGREGAENAFGYIFKSPIENATGVEILATNGIDRLTPEDTIEMKAGINYRFSALSVPMYLSEVITWSSSDESVATVDKYGVVHAIGGGKAIIKATAESGAEQYFNIKVAALKLTNVSYRWDFNDLKATGTHNDLILSGAAQSAAGNYTLTNGIYSTGSKALDYGARPDFNFEKPFMIDSEHDWSIEWRYKAFDGTAVTLMGRTPTAADGDNYLKGRIYLYYAKEWGTGVYPLSMTFEEGNEIKINYGAYRLLNNEMNTWKLAYSKDAKKITLLFYNEETSLWETVGTANAGAFRTTFTTLFGRQNSKGAMNMLGDVDYVKIDAIGYETDEYIWDFNDLTSSAEKNDLTLSELASNTANNYSLKNGIYETKAGLGYTARPDFTLEKAITVDSECNWCIEWRADVTDSTASILMGPTPSSLSDPTIPGYIYLSYSRDWGNGLYPLAFVPEVGQSVNLNYGEYRLKNNEMNTWKLYYNKDTKKLTLYFYDESASRWVVVDDSQMGIFSMTITNLFGRISGGANMNFTGSVDYIRVYTERTE